MHANLLLGLVSRQSSPVKELPQQSNIQSKQQILQPKQSFLVVFVHSIQPNWQKIAEEEFSFTLVATVDGHSDESMKVFKNEALLQFDQNFFFIAKSNSILKFQLMDGSKNKCYAFIQFPIIKLYNNPRVRHRLQVDMIDKQKINRLKIADKIATLNVQMLRLANKIGVLELSIYDASLDRDTGIIAQMDPYLLIKIDGKLYNTDVCKEGGKNPKWNKRFWIPINSILVQMEIIAFNDNQQLSNEKNVIGSTNSINLMESKMLIPTAKQKKQNVSIFFQGKKVGVINMASRFELNKA